MERFCEPKETFSITVQSVFSMNVAPLYSSSPNLPSFPLVVHIPPSHPPTSLFSSFSDSKQPSCCVSPITASILIPLFLPSSLVFFFFLSPFLSNHQSLSLKAKGPLQTLAKKRQEVQKKSKALKRKVTERSAS